MTKVENFINYLDRKLPHNFYPQYKEEDSEVYLVKDGEYVYLFYVQEIEENFELCCSLANTVVELLK